jgi:hypothetical protein
MPGGSLPGFFLSAGKTVLILISVTFPPSNPEDTNYRLIVGAYGIRPWWNFHHCACITEIRANAVRPYKVNFGTILILPHPAALDLCLPKWRLHASTTHKPFMARPHYLTVLSDATAKIRIFLFLLL